MDCQSIRCYDVDMHTTVSIDDEIYEKAKRIALESQSTLGEVINELLAAGLKRTTSPTARRQLGQLRGSITMSDDFDETPKEVLAALYDPV